MTSVTKSFLNSSRTLATSPWRVGAPGRVMVTQLILLNADDADDAEERKGLNSASAIALSAFAFCGDCMFSPMTAVSCGAVARPSERALMQTAVSSTKQESGYRVSVSSFITVNPHFSNAAQ